MNASNAAPLSNVVPPCDVASLDATRRLFQRLFERLAPFIADVPNANERANAAVKALEILRLESRFLPPASPLAPSEPSVDDWRRRVKTALEAVEREISTVESRAERAYLRRLVIDAALSLNACDATFFTEPFSDALLAAIDDSEERQNALVAYATRLAARIHRFPQSDASERAKAFALLDEIEDLRVFERAAGTVAAAVLLDATRRPNSPSLSPNDANATDVTLDLTPFGDDVASVWEQFESPGGFLELCERASAEFFDALSPLSPTPQEIALRQALNAETRRQLAALATALDADVALDGSPLDEDARAELQNVVGEAVIESPIAIENGEFFRAFLERSRNLAAFFPIFKRLDEAENAANNANGCAVSVYRLSVSECAEEKTRWLEAARRVAARSAAFDADVRARLDCLTTYAELEFQFGDKTNGKNAVREALGLLPRLSSPFERASIYRRLVAAHISASYLKAAQKLAALWKAELDAIEPEDLRDAGLVDAFALYSQAVKLDEATLSEFAESLVSPLARLECETRFQTESLILQPVAPSVVDDAACLADSALSAIASLASLAETSPDEAVFTFVKIATAVADVFARPPFATTQNLI